MYLTIADAAAALRAGETTSADLVRAAFAVADAHDAALGVHLARFGDAALAAAARADAELAAGVDRGPLHGIPVGIKDLIATAEGGTTAQSLVLDPAWARAGDGPAVARLRAAGAVVTGKTTTMEFGIGAPDGGKPFPVPRNPWDTSRYTGGSSSGSAAGVAAGLFLGGLGTDSAGSVRYPAALCGVTGLKPTFGRVPKNGCVPLGHSHDHVGPLARTAADCAAILAAVAGPDAGDAASADRPVADYRGALTGSLAGLRVGVDPLPGAARGRAAELDPALDRAAAELRAAGASVVPVELPHYRELTAAARLGLAAEAFARHRDGLRRRWSDYGAGTRMALAKGALLSAADYVQTQRVRRAGQREVAELFAEVDLVVTPTASREAPPVEDLGTDAMAEAAHTAYWNAVGNPVLSVPIGFTRGGLPLGMQIAGRPFDEAAVLAAGDAYQRRTGWHLRVPDLVRDLLAA